MSHLVLISHGDFCVELKKSAEMIMGEQENILAVPFYANEGPEDFQKKFNEATEGLEDFTVFSDLYGGTPNNVAARELIEGKSFELYAGMNLSMVITFVNAGFSGTKPDYVEEAGKSIIFVNEMLQI